jgi:hypothetical protein
MNQATSPETPNSNTVSEFPRCQHRTRKGRCRELVSDAASSLCFKHAAQGKKDQDTANIAARLIGDTAEFTSAVTINRSLGELYKLLARDEIAPRRAAVMTYTCNLLLRTLPAIEHELQGPGQKDNTIIFDITSAVATRALEAQKSKLNQSPSISLAPNATEQA